MSEEINSILLKFRDFVRRSVSVSSEIVLFGAYAKGMNKQWNDIDIAVILPKVDGRFKMEIDLRLKSIPIDYRINPFVFSRKE